MRTLNFTRLATLGTTALVLGIAACTAQESVRGSDQSAPEAPLQARQDLAAKDALGTGDVAGARRLQIKPEEIAVTAAPTAPPTGQLQSTYSASQGDVSIVPTMVIRTGQANVEVQSLDPALGRIRQLAAQLGGYVGNTMMQGGKDQPKSATLELKVPAEHFDRAVSGLSPIGRVEAVSVSAQDVGEEYVDITARATNAQRLEARLLDLLANRTAKLGDMLTVERELARVREEIERYEGRLRWLKSRSAVSTLSISVHEPMPLLGETPSPIGEAFRRAWYNFVNLVAALIASLGTLIPLGVILAVVWIIIRRWLPKFPKPEGPKPETATA